MIKDKCFREPVLHVFRKYLELWYACAKFSNLAPPEYRPKNKSTLTIYSIRANSVNLHLPSFVDSSNHDPGGGKDHGGVGEAEMIAHGSTRASACISGGLIEAAASRGRNGNVPNCGVYNEHT